jgi:3D (Asp-Asp-Asp) domain-containing protein
MSLLFNRWLGAALFISLGTAGATPVLPSPGMAVQAVRGALAPEVRPAPAVRVVRATPRPAAPQPVAAAPAPRPVAPRPVQAQRASAQATQAARAAQTRAQNVQIAQAQAARSTRTGRSAIVRATAYNSLAAQTDSTPFITATGTRTRSGVVALSRDLLRSFPYGSKIMIEDLSGRYNTLLRGRVFSVEDTMAARKTNSLDIWMTTRSQALQFGARQVRITAVR